MVVCCGFWTGHARAHSYAKTQNRDNAKTHPTQRAGADIQTKFPARVQKKKLSTKAQETGIVAVCHILFTSQGDLSPTQVWPLSAISEQIALQRSSGAQFGLCCKTSQPNLSLGCKKCRVEHHIIVTRQRKWNLQVNRYMRYVMELRSQVEIKQLALKASLCAKICLAQVQIQKRYAFQALVPFKEWARKTPKSKSLASLLQLCRQPSQFHPALEWVGHLVRQKCQEKARVRTFKARFWIHFQRGPGQVIFCKVFDHRHFSPLLAKLCKSFISCR